MHCDHDVFLRAIRDKKKIELTFVDDERDQNKTKLFGPIKYGTHAAGIDPDCYYVWDFEGKGDNDFLVLAPSEIESIELAEEPFDLLRFFSDLHKKRDSQNEKGDD